MRLTDLDPQALDELRAAGYTVRTVDDALEAARACYGISHEAALVFLGGPGDNVVEG